MSARSPGAEPYMPDSVVRRLLDGFPAGCFGHDSCRRCELLLRRLERGKRLASGLARPVALARLRKLQEQMDGTPRAAWERPRPVEISSPDGQVVRVQPLCDGLCPDAVAGVSPCRHVTPVRRERARKRRGRS